MSDHFSQRGAPLAQFEEHLTSARYNSAVVRRYLGVADRFLNYLRKRHVLIDAAQPSHLTMYVRGELRRFARRHGRPPVSIDHWRALHTVGIHKFLRWTMGRWPPAAAARNSYAAFSQALCADYAQWLQGQRGLAAVTIGSRVAEARRFLAWYGERGSADSLCAVATTDIDAYFRARALSLRRISLSLVATHLRCLLRFAHDTGRTTRDLAFSVMAPTLYALESIPSALRPEEVRVVEQATRLDRSPKGLRDYAIVLLLSTYGLRSGEVARLRLNDINWRADEFCVRHTKTGSQSVLPLLPAVGDALLAYLRQGRPKTDAREIFICMRAPYRGFASSSSLYSLIRERLEAAGVYPAGKRGPHAFRHARAVSLLHSGIPLKVIGDVLGHRSAASTRPYLKLATEDLRDVALEIPGRIGEEQS